MNVRLQWPWRVEKREAEDATTDQAALTTALLNARGAVSAATGGIAALEAAAGVWGRAFASAAVAPATALTRLLTPRVLGEIGRGLIQRGETVHWVEAGPMGAMLCQARTWDVLGRGVDPSTWRYRVHQGTPTGTATRVLGADMVLHCRYSTRPGLPWRGVGPLGHANLSAEVAGMIEQSLRGEFCAPTGQVFFTGDKAVMLDDDPHYDSQQALLEELAKMERGRGNFALGTANADPVTSYDDQISGPPASERFGPNPPAEVDEVRESVMDSVYAACGVSPAIFKAQSAGAAREAWRQFLHGAVAPVAKLVAEEVGMKLNAPTLALSFAGLFASDLTGRARAFNSLVGGGLDASEARTLAGFE